MNIEQRECPLRFSSFIGDHNTVKCLLLGSIWEEKYINEALKLASIHGHIKTVDVIIQDGRADLDFEDGVSLTTAALQDNCEIVSLLLDAGANVSNAVPVAIWNIHQDQVNTFREIWLYDKSICTSRYLYNAIRVMSYSCIDFIILNFTGKKDTSIIDLCIDLKWTDSLIIRLENDFPCSGKALKLGRNRPHLSKKIRNANVKRRWKQAKTVLLLGCFWRNFCWDYYSPGNENYPPGKGYLKAKDEFNSHLD